MLDCKLAPAALRVFPWRTVESRVAATRVTGSSSHYNNYSIALHVHAVLPTTTRLNFEQLAFDRAEEAQLLTTRGMRSYAAWCSHAAD